MDPNQRSAVEEEAAYLRRMAENARAAPLATAAAIGHGYGLSAVTPDGMERRRVENEAVAASYDVCALLLERVLAGTITRARAHETAVAAIDELTVELDRTEDAAISARVAMTRKPLAELVAFLNSLAAR